MDRRSGFWHHVRMDTQDIFQRLCSERECARAASHEFWALRCPESVPLCPDHTHTRSISFALASDAAVLTRALQMPVCDDPNCGRESTFCLAPIPTVYRHHGGASACAEHVAVMLLGYHDIGLTVTVSQYRFGRVFK